MAVKGKKKFISQEYSTESKGRNLKEGTKRSRGLTIFAASFFGFALIIGVTLVAFTIVFFYSDVKGTSMMKVLNANGHDVDSVIVNRYKKPQRGDIIVVEHYDADGRFDSLHIKRLVALGGEWVHIHDAGEHYEFQVNGTSHDSNWPKVNNMGHNANFKSNHYNEFFIYQRDGIVRTSMLASSRVINDGGHFIKNPGFRTHYRADGKDHKSGIITKSADTVAQDEIPFRQYNEDRKRNEFQLPNNYIFYMGDNRGGNGLGGSVENDVSKMSIDCTYFGPQPTSRIVGVVTEIVQEKSAPEWFLKKLGYFFTFRWGKLGGNVN